MSAAASHYGLNRHFSLTTAQLSGNAKQTRKPSPALAGEGRVGAE